MTDLQSLFSQAARAGDGPAAEGVVDADLVRGRRALTHRRMRRTGTRSVLAAALAIGTFAAVSPHGGHDSASTATGKPASASIKLVAWTGAQPQGYTVDSVPAGWEIQGVNNFVLAIAPIGFPNQRLDVFSGKLVVMLLSPDEAPPTTGTRVDIGVAGTGRISHLNPEPILTFEDSHGRWLDIQVPVALHWTDAQVVAFGEAVHANATAVAGRG